MRTRLTPTDAGTSVENDGVNGFEPPDHLLNYVRALEKRYSAEFERRIAQVTQALNSELEAKVKEIRVQYEQRYTLLQQKFEEYRGRISQCSDEGLEEEIARVKADAEKCAAELERSVSDDSIALGQLLQIRTRELEVRAYLRGLTYRGRTLDASESAKPSAG